MSETSDEEVDYGSFDSVAKIQTPMRIMHGVHQRKCFHSAPLTWHCSQRYFQKNIRKLAVVI